MPLKPVLSGPPCFVDEPSQDTDSVSSDESMSMLSPSVKRKLPVPTELKRENAFRLFKTCRALMLAQLAGKENTYQVNNCD